MKKQYVLLLGILIYSFQCQAQLIYSNGSIVNHPGAGSGGADISCFHHGLSSFGFGQQLPEGYRLADDFTIPAGQIWTIDSIGFYAYQSNSGIVSTINAVNCAIYNGSPALGNTIVLGDTVTNLIQGTDFSNIYRTADGQFNSVTRPVMFSIIVPQNTWTLSAGNYWLSWQSGGNVSFSGPWVPPLTDTVNTTTGDALQFSPDSSVWIPVLDVALSTPQGLPFEIYGTITTSINNVEVEDILTVMPNPSKGTFRINAAFTGKTNLEINVTDLMGKTVYSNMLNDISVVSKTIELKNAAKGVYVLKLNSDSGKTLTKKIVVE